MTVSVHLLNRGTGAVLPQDIFSREEGAVRKVFLMADHNYPVEVLGKRPEFMDHALAAISIEASESFIDDERADGGAAAEVWAEAGGQGNRDAELLAARYECHLQRFMGR